MATTFNPFTGSLDFTAKKQIPKALGFVQQKENVITLNPAPSAFPYTLSEVLITTDGKPILICANGDANPINSSGWCRLQLYRGTTPIGTKIQAEGNAANENSPYSISYVDEPGQGTFSYSLRVDAISGPHVFGEVEGPVLYAIELAAEKGDKGEKGDQGTAGISNPTYTSVYTVNTPQASTSIEPEKIIFNTIKYENLQETGGWWNMDLNAFKPTLAGWYFVVARAEVDTDGLNSLSLYKNGGYEQNIGNSTGTTSSKAIGGTGLIYLNGTDDYLEIYASCGNTGYTYSTEENKTYLQVSGPVYGTGFKGDQGEKGEKGDQGNQGYPGLDGAQGPTGPAGSSVETSAVFTDRVALDPEGELTFLDELVGNWSWAIDPAVVVRKTIAMQVHATAFRTSPGLSTFLLLKDGNTVATRRFYFNQANVHMVIPPLFWTGDFDLGAEGAQFSFSIQKDNQTLVDSSDFASVYVTSYVGPIYG